MWLWFTGKIWKQNWTNFELTLSCFVWVVDGWRPNCTLSHTLRHHRVFFCLITKTLWRVMIRTVQANGFHLLYFLSNTKGWQRWKEIENLRVWRSTIKSWDWNLKKMSEFNFRYSVSSTTASCLAATADTRKFVPSLLLVWNCLYCNWHWAVCGKFFDHWKSHRLHKKLFQQIYEQELSRTNERHYLWMWTELQSHGKFDLKCCCKTSRYFFELNWIQPNLKFFLV